MSFTEDLEITTNKKIVAIFDFDGTLTQCATTLPFLRFAFPIKYIFLMPFWLPALLLFACHLITIDQLNNFICRLFFKNKSSDLIKCLGASFAHNKIPKLLKPEAIDKLKMHQEQGHYCILATAAYEVYVKYWAKNFGFDDVVCTLFEVESNKFSGALAGLSCYGAEKAKKIKSLLAENEEIYAYGDSRGDKEMLELAHYPFYRSF
jgi:phosphatidylglycerophosphatase C